MALVRGRCGSRSGRARASPGPRRAAQSVSTVASVSPSDRSSALEPWATSRPTCITPRWVHICSTSASRWLETSTVVPSPASDPTSWRTSRVPCGSSPLVGSSSTSRSLGVSRARGDGESLPHPERVGPVALAGRGQQADAVERGVDPAYGGRGVGGAVGGVEPEQVAPAREVGVERRVLRPGRRRRQHAGRRVPASARRTASTSPGVAATSASSIRIVVVFPEPFGPRKP